MAKQKFTVNITGNFYADDYETAQAKAIEAVKVLDRMVLQKVSLVGWTDSEGNAVTDAPVKSLFEDKASK